MTLADVHGLLVWLAEKQRTDSWWEEMGLMVYRECPEFTGDSPDPQGRSYHVQAGTPWCDWLPPFFDAQEARQKMSAVVAEYQTEHAEDAAAVAALFA